MYYCRNTDGSVTRLQPEKIFDKFGLSSCFVTKQF